MAEIFKKHPKALELLVVGFNMNESNTFAETLRNAGLAVHLKTAENNRQLPTVLEKEHADMALVSANDECEESIQQIREFFPDCGVLLISDTPRQHLSTAVELQVLDVINRPSKTHLALAVRREFQALLNRRELNALRTELDEVEKRCATLTEDTKDAIAYLHDGMHVYANSVYATLFGFDDADELEGLPAMDLVAMDGRNHFKKILRKLEKGEAVDEVQINCLTEQGEEFEAMITFSSTTMEGEECTQIIVRNLESGDDHDFEQRLAELANKDSHTGLFNRQYFMGRLADAVSNLEENNRTLALLQVSITNHNEIQEDCGLEASDELLREVARILNHHVPKNDLLARFGEHDFTILSGDQEYSPEDKAKYLLQVLENKMLPVPGLSVPPVFSVGIAYSDAPTPVSSSYDFYNRVTDATKQSAEMEGNAVSAYDQQHAAASTVEAVTDEQVRLIDDSLKNNRFDLLYQPIISLQGDTRENYAVFLRVLDEDNQMHAPHDFLQKAANANRLAEIDRWIIRHAIEELVTQRTAGRKVNFFINIFGASITDESLLLWVCDCLREYKAKGAWITFQFKQSDMRQYIKGLKPLIDGLKKINCKIAIDHFSDEDDGMEILEQLAIDIVKFAPSYMESFGNNKEKSAQFEHINRVIQGKGLKSVATWVEEAGALAMLWNIGVNYIQGNFIQQPSSTISYDFNS